MTTSIESLGFLSSESEEFRASVRLQFRAQFAEVESASEIAIAELSAISGDAAPSYIIGVLFWLRSIESSQATVLLAERGLSTSPFSVLRTALERLFAACAVWRKPEVADKIDAWHHEERVKQAKQILSVEPEGRVTPEGLAELKAIAAETVSPSGWSHWEAATAADLQFEYAMLYRVWALVEHMRRREVSTTFMPLSQMEASTFMFDPPRIGLPGCSGWSQTA